MHPCTVHGTYKFHFSATFSLKMDLMALFTYLKMILLQYFQFSVFNFSKISSIRTDSKRYLNRPLEKSFKLLLASSFFNLEKG